MLILNQWSTSVWTAMTTCYSLVENTKMFLMMKLLLSNKCWPQTSNSCAAVWCCAPIWNPWLYDMWEMLHGLWLGSVCWCWVWMDWYIVFKHSGLKIRLKLIIVQIKILKDFAVKMFFSETYLIKHLTLPELQWMCDKSQCYSRWF